VEPIRYLLANGGVERPRTYGTCGGWSGDAHLQTGQR